MIIMCLGVIITVIIRGASESKHDSQSGPPLDDDFNLFNCPAAVMQERGVRKQVYNYRYIDMCSPYLL